MKFGRNSEIWLKLKNLVDILKFCWNLAQILKFGQNFEIWSKFWNLVEILKFGQNSEIWLKFWNLVEILKFGWNFEIWSNVWNLVEILKFGQNSEIWAQFWNLVNIVLSLKLYCEIKRVSVGAGRLYLGGWANEGKFSHVGRSGRFGLVWSEGLLIHNNQ